MSEGEVQTGAPPTPLGVGLALIGAATLVISAFLPWADTSSTGFSRLAKNTLVQHGDWVVLVAAAVVGFDVVRFYTQRRVLGLVSVLWAPGVAIVLLIAEAAQKSHFQFYPIGPDGTPDTSVPATPGSPGVGLYVGIVGAVVAAAGLVAMRRIAADGLAETKRCPDCAEIVLAQANVCKHCGHRFGTSGRSQTAAAGGEYRMNCKSCGAASMVLSADDRCYACGERVGG
jgi:zinc-ribbon domain